MDGLPGLSKRFRKAFGCAEVWHLGKMMSRTSSSEESGRYVIVKGYVP
jgi:hypothetical protein